MTTSSAVPARAGWRALRDDALASPSFFPLLGAIAIFTWFGAAEAGFETGTWYPGTLLLLALLVLCLIALPRPRPSRAALVAIGLLAGYAAWSYASILWADQKGLAWDGGNRSLLYAIALALFALWPPRGRAAAALLGIWALAVAGIGLVELLRASAAADPIGFFFEARLVEPAGYVNANVALWFGAFWPCLVFAGRREVHPALRGIFLAAAGLLAGLALLGQSRGWLLVLPVMALLALVVVPGRARTLAALCAVGVCVAAVAGPLLDVYEGFTPGSNLGPELDTAARALLVACALLAVLGLGAGLLERRLGRGSGDGRGEARADLVAIALTAVAVVGALVAFTVAVGNPVTEASDYWSDFKAGGVSPGAGEARLTGTAATDRYDFWRVGWAMFEDRPLTGYGSDNFQHEYLKRGDGEQQPRYPHSLEVRVLAQTGAIGALLLLGALVAAAVAAFPGLRTGGVGAATTGAALLVTIYWLVHGSLDWFWEFAGLGGPAFAALGLAMALGDAARGRQPAGTLPRPALAGAVAVALVGAASLLAPWLSNLYLERGSGSWLSNPTRSAQMLDRAAALNPLSPLPDLAAGTIAVRQGRLDAAAESFESALERDPEDVYATMMLGAIASERGDRNEALRYFRDSAVLAPRYDVAQDSLRALEAGKELQASAVDRAVARATRARIGLSQ